MALRAAVLMSFFKFLRPVEGGRLWCYWCCCCFIHTLYFPSPLTRCPMSLLCLWCGEVPGGILGALPHGAHQSSKAHVFGFLQPPHQPLLHNGYELLITKFSVPWGRQTGGGEREEGERGNGQGRDDEIIEGEWVRAGDDFYLLKISTCQSRGGIICFR